MAKLSKNELEILNNAIDKHKESNAYFKIDGFEYNIEDLTDKQLKPIIGYLSSQLETIENMNKGIMNASLDIHYILTNENIQPD